MGLYYQNLQIGCFLSSVITGLLFYLTTIIDSESNKLLMMLLQSSIIVAIEIIHFLIVLIAIHQADVVLPDNKWTLLLLKIKLSCLVVIFLFSYLCGVFRSA